MKHNTIFVTIFCLMLVVNKTAFADSNLKHILNEKGLYIIVAASTDLIRDPKFQEIHWPSTRICRLKVSEEKNGLLFFNGLDLVNEFEALQTDKIDVFYERGLAIIRTTNEPYSEYVTNNVVSLKEPWKDSGFKDNHLNLLSLATIGGKEILISYEHGKKPIITSYDRLDFKKKIMNPEQYLPYASAGSDFLIQEDGRLKYDIWGLKQYYYPYQPPKDMVKGKEKAYLIGDTTRFIVIGFGKKRTEKTIEFIIMDKKTKNWTKHIIEGESSTTMLFENVLLNRLATFSKDSRHTGQYTGEWAVINLKDGKVKRVHLSTEALIVYAEENFIFYTRDTELRYCPVINGKLSLTNSQVIYSDKKSTYGTEKQLVPYIKYVFFGPKKLPKH